MLKKWFSLDEFITPSIIRFCYVIGTVLVTLVGLVFIASDIFNPLSFRGYALKGLVMLIGGNLILRVSCESWLLLFGIYERLKKQN
ncbi:MAG TPA: DUF4282 domain-containing protein [Bacillota bacterium]|nr:DUF4282 domain-containing protein [Bacillota bacterium]